LKAANEMISKEEENKIKKTLIGESKLICRDNG